MSSRSGACPFSAAYIHGHVGQVKQSIAHQLNLSAVIQVFVHVFVLLTADRLLAHVQAPHQEAIWYGHHSRSRGPAAPSPGRNECAWLFR